MNEEELGKRKTDLPPVMDARRAKNLFALLSPQLKDMVCTGTLNHCCA